MPKTRPFKQRDLMSTLPKSFGLFREGICRSLVAQWLAAQGHFRRTAFGKANSAQAWRDADEVILRDMNEERVDMLKLHVVAHVNSHRFELNQFMQMSELLATGGGFYLALRDPTSGAGHALGVYVNGEKWRLFDPNEASHSGQRSDVLNRLATALAAYAKGEPAPLVNGEPAWRLTQWEVEEVLV